MGNEAVDQLTKFDRALRDFSFSAGRGRGIDGMLITKWDTVDDKVGDISVSSLADDSDTGHLDRLVRHCR